MVEFEVGQPLKPDKIERWAELATAGLAEGETILAMHSGSRIRPATDLAIITPARVILVATIGGGFDFKLEYRLAQVVEVRANKMGMHGQVQLVMADGDKEKFGTASALHSKAGAAACAAAIERARQHPDGPAISVALPPAGPKYQPTLKPPHVPTKVEAKAAGRIEALEERKEGLRGRLEERHAQSEVPAAPSRLEAKAAERLEAIDARRQELQGRLDERRSGTGSASVADTVLGPDVRTVGGLPSKKATQVIIQHCQSDERPWLVINAGSAGVLAAFDDRLMVIKTGAVTSFMAGSLGGGRTATFHYSDVTGIEYNSGLLNGVLEILTPSYSGGAQKDFWKGTNKSRNADSNDPWTLSNTLPLPKPLHAEALPYLNELRSRIAAAKRTVVITQAPPPPPAPAGGGLAAEIAELAGLRDAGVLSEEEFAAAKAKLLGG